MSLISSNYRIKNSSNDSAVQLDGNPTSQLNPPEFADSLLRLNHQSKTEGWCNEYLASQLENLASQNPDVAASIGLPTDYASLKRLVDKGDFDHNPLFNGDIIQKQEFKKINHGNLKEINAIVLHRTDSTTAQSTLNCYNNQNEGAHYLIDTDGTIYQTLGLNKQAWHVGKIRSKCNEQKNCSEDESKTIKPLLEKPTPLYNHEKVKLYPERFPMNSDSIGIEVVGDGDVDKGYSPPTPEQLESTQQLVNGLMERLSLTSEDVYKHGVISAKDNPRTEGAFLGFD